MSPTSTVADLEFLRHKTALPSLPALALEVIKLSQGDEPDIDGIGKVVGRDPSFAAKLIKLANSPIFGRAREVTNIPQAMMVLGLKAVKMAAISLSLAPTLGRTSKAYQEVYACYWRRAVTCAVGARAISKHLNRPYGEDAFLCALMMDVGFPVALASHHAPYQPAIRSATTGHPDCETERAAIGATHADISAHLLRDWGLSESIVMPVLHHHDPDGMPPESSLESREITRILSMSHDIATVLSPRADGATALAEVQRKGHEWFNMHGEVTLKVLNDLTDAVVEMARLMDLDVGSNDELMMLLASAQEDLMTVVLGASMELESTKHRVEALEKKASTDALTGIRNRASFDEEMTRHFEARERGDDTTSIGVIMADVDKFKKFNDTYGHQAGDEVLKVVAKALETNTRTQDRKTDVVCRYGGEEFVAICPNLHQEDLLMVAERLRKAVEGASVLTPAGTLKVTASFGACLLEKWFPGVTPGGVLKIADQNLYAAKEAGRNRSVISVYPQS